MPKLFLLIISLGIAISIFSQSTKGGNDIYNPIRLNDNIDKIVLIKEKRSAFFKYHSNTPIRVALYINAENNAVRSSKFLVQIESFLCTYFIYS